ncbi:uncharacterized protein [Asterias amurensis]|uniref:uncharacterized protein n=1 Tax=Asterias amurensis TaxID=7602 RepID=UPI003AB5D122
MTWNYVLRINVLLGLCVALAHCQNEQAQQTSSSAASTSTQAPQPQTAGDEGGLSSDQRAALWAGFVGGMVCIFGMGMLFYDMVVRKYSQQYQYARRVDMHVETYKP